MSLSRRGSAGCASARMSITTRRMSIGSSTCSASTHELCRFALLVFLMLNPALIRSEIQSDRIVRADLCLNFVGLVPVDDIIVAVFNQRVQPYAQFRTKRFFRYYQVFQSFHASIGLAVIRKHPLADKRIAVAT